MARRPFLPPFTEIDAVLLSTTIAAQIDTRFLALDLARGSRIYWTDVATRMTQSTGRRWQETECQRLWRYCAYGEDIGQRQSLLPDSDGEDDAVHSASQSFFFFFFSYPRLSPHFPLPYQ